MQLYDLWPPQPVATRGVTVTSEVWQWPADAAVSWSLGGVRWAVGGRVSSDLLPDVVDHTRLVPLRCPVISVTSR